MASPKNITTRPPQLVGAKPGSKEYGIKYTTLRDIVHRGEIAHLRIGRAMYLDRVDIENWIAAKKERG